MGPDQLGRLKQALTGHYQFERELGEGAFATVFLARDLRHERLVAIKVLHIEPSSDLNEIRFLREIRFLAGLQHPNIVPVHDSGHVEDLLYYVMPYVRGESLRERLKRERRLSIADGVRITCEIADALDTAHSSGVIHRDIKPENILLSGSHPMLADFGVARAINISHSKKITRPGFGSPGTPAYMSPEQMLGEGAIDNRADIYSLGCVLFEMLTGEAPFEAAGGLVRRFNEPPPSARALRPDVSLVLDQAISKALARTPQERFATANDMAKGLAEAATQPIPSHEDASDDVAKNAGHIPSVDDGRGVSGPGRLVFPRRWVGVGGLVAGLLVVVPAIALLAHRFAASSNAQDGSASSIHPLDPRRVAVLYFDDLTAGKTLGPIAGGLTEDLIDGLSQVQALHVISPNGVRPYQGKATRLDSLATQLDVGTIVSGSVASSGPILRVTVRLIDAATGQELQSRTLEQRSKELFSLQDQLATEVALFLRERLGREIRLREQRAETKSVAAWQTTQEGEQAAQQGAALIRVGEERPAVNVLLHADSLFVRAQRLDPKWIVPTINRGWLAYSFAFVTPELLIFVRDASRRAKLTSRTQSGSVSEWMLRGIEYADTALTRRPDAPEALALRGELRYRLVLFDPHSRADTLMPLAEADLRMALAARPDFARAWFSLGDLYYQQGRFSESRRSLRAAYDADAFLTEIRSVVSLLFLASLHGENFKEADSWCRVGLKRYPGDPRFADCELGLLGRAARGRRQAAAAWALVTKVERGDSVGMLAPLWAYRRMMVAAVLARSGMNDSARAVLSRTRSELPSHSGSSDPSLDEAYVYLLLGDREGALRILATRLAAAPNERSFVARSPWYRDLRADPRFSVLVQPAA